MVHTTPEYLNGGVFWAWKLTNKGIMVAIIQAKFICDILARLHWPNYLGHIWVEHYQFEVFCTFLFFSKVIPEEPLEDVKLQPPQKKIKIEEKVEKNIKSLHWNNDGEAIKIREFMDKILFKSESDLSDRLPTNIDKKNRSFVILRSDDPLNPSPCAVSDDSGKL